MTFRELGKLIEGLREEQKDMKVLAKVAGRPGYVWCERLDTNDILITGKEYGRPTMILE